MFNWFKHDYPYTNFHELNIDWVIERIRWLVDKVSTIASVNTSFFYERFAFYADNPVDKDGRWYYVSVHGSDTYNDGLTPDKPVRTMRRAIELASLRCNDVRIRICASGTYDVDYLLYTNNALHIDCTAPDVVLNYTHVGIHYMTHINFSGYDEEHKMIIRCENPRNLWYMDGGAGVFDNCKFECTVRLNQAGATSYRCTFSSLLLFDSKFTLVYHTGFTNSTDSRGSIYLYNSELFNTTPNLTCELISDDPNPFLHARGSRISNTQVYTNETEFKWNEYNVGQSVFLTSNSSYQSISDFVTYVNVDASNTISNITLT